MKRYMQAKVMKNNEIKDEKQVKTIKNEIQKNRK